MSDTFKIIRFNRDKPNKIIERGLSLEEAKFHCSQKDTKGDDWFDGYTKE